MNARTFLLPLRLTFDPPALIGRWDRSRISNPISSLPERFVSYFHRKDTVLYTLAVRPYELEDVYDVIWKVWYPRRDLHPKVDTVWDGFFCQPMMPDTKWFRKVDLAQIVDFQEQLVKAVDAHEKSEADVGKKLDDLLRHAFIVLDKEEWETDGVLIVCCEESLLELGLENEGGQAVEGTDGWFAFSKGLEDVVKMVICDPERKKALAPVLEKYRAPKFRI
ncbi:uncharacterized protein TRUGW13939_01511 [Talaromyces rugulosus]|uniref:Uncharacterized protein n=1 Tax=Talaromyces rugulosus TaxID=121627 RepID=A0A7H8QLL7_TALRU|nr:uncharacterized protein TRUGW13939_01511 [Talaromyces rugulosus]QKX54425.1 hypothetical protein TRUGW13939_01511 [Talaromyces rugulosus]